MFKMLKRTLAALLSAVLLLSCVPCWAEAAVAAEAPAPVYYTHDGRVTFVEGATTDQPIRSLDDAAQVVQAMIQDLGGDERTQFEPWRVVTDTVGNNYYIFQQMYAETTVSGGAVKVVTDRDGHMLGLVSSVETELPEIETSEGIDEKQAEAIVMAHEADKNPDILEGRTEKIVLPVNLEIDMESEEEKEESRFVWVVYTTNPAGSVSTGSDLPYLAHYVTLSGEYLYSLPTVVPGDEASTSGYDAAYVFEFMESVPYTGTVTLSDGREREITVDVMRDQRTGMYYLGNVERRIAVADCYNFLYEKGRVILEASPDNTGWDQTCLLSLYNYCQAWDYYNAIGWKGGDGLGTPMLILKDYCDSNHTPVNNAAYAGKYYGWQIFLSSSINDFSQALDVLGHEFTHCVTGSVMTYNAYMNDYGAINEAMSDIQGNLCEMIRGETTDTTWMLGENSSTPVRSMSDPHMFNQPEYAWDLYYVPAVKVPTDLNDRGGVHSNSSLLNNVAYRLCVDGSMPLNVAREYWFAVDCSMVPGTDYAQLSELMPWVLDNLGLSQYRDALEAAMDFTRMRTDAIPDTFDEDRALLTLTLPDSEIFTDGNWALMILSVDVDGILSRIDDMTNRRGEYADALDELEAIMGAVDWETSDSGEPSEPFDLLDMLSGLMAGAEANADDQASEEGEELELDPAEVEKISDALSQMVGWYKKYLSDLIYYGTGAAGQDGRTMRMVCRPGMTLPILLRLEMKPESLDYKSVGLAVYTFGSWYDVAGMIVEFAGETFDENGEVNLDQLDLGFLGLGDISGEASDEQGQISEEQMSQIVDNLMAVLGNMTWLRDMIFYRIKGGETNVIPSAGLENVSYVDSEALEQIFPTAMMNTTDN